MKPREALKGKLIDPSDLDDFSAAIKAKGKKIVFTSGNWDLIHLGQMRYLAEARKLGDLLVVGVQSNEAIKKVKGPNKPILDEMVRAETLVFLKCVDFVTIVPIPSAQPTLKLLKPDIYVTVIEDWNSNYKESKEYKTVTNYGGEVQLVDRQSPSISTSKIIAKVASGELAAKFQEYIDKYNVSPLKERFGK